SPLPFRRVNSAAPLKRHSRDDALNRQAFIPPSELGGSIEARSRPPRRWLSTGCIPPSELGGSIEAARVLRGRNWPLARIPPSELGGSIEAEPRPRPEAPVPSIPPSELGGSIEA